MLIERYRRWFEYERDCNAKVMASLNAVPEPQRKSEGFGKACTLMAHLLTARQLWLYRLGVGSERPSTLFPENVPLEELARRLVAIETAWTAFLNTTDDATLERDFEYRALDGGGFRNRIEDVFTQLFGHAWYHRGQIATLLRSLGATPPITDFIYWTREPLGTVK